MDENGGVDKQSATNKKKPNYLVAVLILFLVVIIGLVIGIIINNNYLNKQEEVSCGAMDNEYDMRVCLSQQEANDELGDRYDANIEEAFNSGNYDLFGDLVEDRSSDLALDNQCDVSLDWLDSIEEKYVKDLPIMDQYGFYVSGKQVATECENLEKEAYYTDKINTILADEKYSAAAMEVDQPIEEYDGSEYEEE